MPSIGFRGIALIEGRILEETRHYSAADFAAGYRRDVAAAPVHPMTGGGDADDRRHSVKFQFEPATISVTQETGPLRLTQPTVRTRSRSAFRVNALIPSGAIPSPWNSSPIGGHSPSPARNTAALASPT